MPLCHFCLGIPQSCNCVDVLVPPNESVACPCWVLWVAWLTHCVWLVFLSLFHLQCQMWQCLSPMQHRVCGLLLFHCQLLIFIWSHHRNTLSFLLHLKGLRKMNQLSQFLKQMKQFYQLHWRSRCSVLGCFGHNWLRCNFLAFTVVSSSDVVASSYWCWKIFMCAVLCNCPCCGWSSSLHIGDRSVLWHFPLRC